MEAISVLSKENMGIFERKIIEIEGVISKNTHVVKHFSLQSGWLGVCLFQCFLAKYRKDNRWRIDLWCSGTCAYLKRGHLN